MADKTNVTALFIIIFSFVRLSSGSHPRRSAHPGCVVTRLDDPLSFRVPNSNLLLGNMEGDGLRFLRSEVYPGETFQRAAWSLDAAHILPQIELGHLVPVSISGICNIGCNLDIALAPERRNLDGKMVVAESRVTQSESKRKQRLAVGIPLFVDSPTQRVVK